MLVILPRLNCTQVKTGRRRRAPTPIGCRDGLTISNPCGSTQGVTKRCLLSWVYQERPRIWAQKRGGGGGGVGGEPMRTAVHRSSNKLWRSTRNSTVYWTYGFTAARVDSNPRFILPPCLELSQPSISKPPQIPTQNQPPPLHTHPCTHCELCTCPHGRVGHRCANPKWGWKCGYWKNVNPELKNSLLKSEWRFHEKSKSARSDDSS